MFLLVSYDISSNQTRGKISKYLKDYGLRVQKSVFEGNINMDQYKEIKEKLKSLIDRKTDRICFYRFCDGCKGKVEISGWGEVAEDDEFYLV